MGKGGGATCECGQVRFDTGGRKAGDKLVCPWCQRHYRYLGGEKIELIGSADEMEARAAATEKKEKPSKAAKSAKSAKSEKKEQREKRDKDRAERGESNGASSVSSRGKSADRPVAGSVRTAKVKPVNMEAEAEGRGGIAGGTRRTKRPADIPGGALMMVIFIVAFNALAFLLLAIVMPRLPSGVRQPVWGGADIPKSAIWPELAALLVGHVTGFIAWSWYVYQLQKFKRLESQAQENSGKPGRKSARGETAERR